MIKFISELSVVGSLCLSQASLADSFTPGPPPLCTRPEILNAFTCDLVQGGEVMFRFTTGCQYQYNNAVVVIRGQKYEGLGSVASSRVNYRHIGISRDPVNLRFKSQQSVAGELGLRGSNAKELPAVGSVRVNGGDFEAFSGCIRM